MDYVVRGRVWKFGDDINTDLMLPGFVLGLPEEEQPKHCFSANRPGWSSMVQPGDIIVGGKNYGTGSSRPAARVLKALGIGGLLADSINGLFLRNCINFGFVALPSLGVSAAFEEGDIAEVDFQRGRIKNVTRGTTLSTIALPQQLLDIIAAGGIVEVLRKEGYVD